MLAVEDVGTRLLDYPLGVVADAHAGALDALAESVDTDDEEVEHALFNVGIAQDAVFEDINQALWHLIHGMVTRSPRPTRDVMTWQVWEEVNGFRFYLVQQIDALPDSMLTSSSDDDGRVVLPIDRRR